MKYFHRTSVPPGEVMRRAAAWFGGRLGPTEEGSRKAGFSGALGRVTIEARPEGGHYTLVTVATDQPGESELDKFAKRFLGTVHQLAEPAHALRGAY